MNACVPGWHHPSLPSPPSAQWVLFPWPPPPPPRETQWCTSWFFPWGKTSCQECGQKKAFGCQLLWSPLHLQRAALSKVTPYGTCAICLAKCREDVKVWPLGPNGDHLRGLVQVPCLVSRSFTEPALPFSFPSGHSFCLSFSRVAPWTFHALESISAPASWESNSQQFSHAFGLFVRLFTFGYLTIHQDCLQCSFY